MTHFNRLLYVSEVDSNAGSRLQSTLEDILIVSAKRNRSDDLTGLLLCDGVSFTQVLEGPATALWRCYQRIAADARHRRISLRLLEAVSVRRYPLWSMCGLYLSALDDALMAAGDIDFDVGVAQNGALLQRLQSLGDRHGDALNEQHRRLLNDLPILARPAGRSAHPPRA